MRKTFGMHTAPHKKALNVSIAMFKTTINVADEYVKNAGKTLTVCVEENKKQKEGSIIIITVSVAPEKELQSSKHVLKEAFNVICSSTFQMVVNMKSIHNEN